MKISVCLPAYLAGKTIRETLNSILDQSFTDFEIVVVDNASTDMTQEIVRSFDDPRVKYFRNPSNLGCGGNLEACRQKASADILFYMCADDILLPGALGSVHRVFAQYPKVGVLVRPYFWFQEKLQKPVRSTKQFLQETFVDFSSAPEVIRDVIALSDQISGIAFRRPLMKGFFSNEAFVEMASVVIPTFKSSGAVILKDNIVGVRISDNGSMKSEVYKKSPMERWQELVESNFSSPQDAGIRRFLIHQFVARNYVGLIQIRNFGTLGQWDREVKILVKLNHKNVFSPRFWFFVIGTFLLPPVALRWLTDNFKNKVMARYLTKINIGGTP